MKKFLVGLIAGLAVTVPLFAVATQPSVPPAGYEDTVLTNIGAYQNPFPDTDMSQLGGKAAAELYRRAVIGGFPDGQFKGDQPVNRAEAAKFLLLARFRTVDDVSNSNRFPDVLDNQWYTKFVVTAANKGIISGYPDGTFKPANQVNAAEFLKMLSLTFELQLNTPYSYADVSASDWFAPYAGIAQKYNLFPGRLSSLHPESSLSRQDVAVAIYQYLLNRNIGSSSSSEETQASSSSSSSTIHSSSTILSPKEGEQWQIGNTYTVQWDANAFGGSTVVSIALVNNDTKKVCDFDGIANDGSYAFTVPAKAGFGSCDEGSNVPGDDYQIIISTKAASLQSNNFSLVTVAHPFITLISPNGGEKWAEGSTQVIKWTSTGVQHVGIEARCGGKPLGYITMNTPSTGQYSWIIPIGYVTGFSTTGCNSMYVRVEDLDHMTTVFDDNDSSFSIVGESEAACIFPWTKIHTPSGSGNVPDENATVQFQGKIWAFDADGLGNLFAYSSTDGSNWTRESTLPAGAAAHSAFLWGSKMYVGVDVYSPQRGSWLYATSDGHSWEQVSSLPSEKGNLVVFDGRIWLIGGRTLTKDADGYDMLTAVSDVYSSQDAGKTWQKGKSLPVAKTGHATLQYGNKLYVFGGGTLDSSNNAVPSEDVYSLNHNQEWQKETSLPAPVAYAYAVYSGKGIVLFANDRVYRSSDEGATWREVTQAKLPTKLFGNSTNNATATIYNNDVYVIGSFNFGEMYKFSCGDPL